MSNFKQILLVTTVLAALLAACSPQPSDAANAGGENEGQDLNLGMPVPGGDNDVPEMIVERELVGTTWQWVRFEDTAGLNNIELTDLGQYTLSIEATTPALLDVFLNVITLLDPPATRPTSAALESTEAAGVLIEDRFVLFSRDRGTLPSLAVDLPATATGLVMNLAPDTSYWHQHDGTTLHVDDADNGGTMATSSAMGVLVIGG